MSSYTQAASELEELQNCGVRFIYLTPYQIRIEEALDVWVKNRKYHDIRNNRRGRYNNLLPFVRKFLTRSI
jgi:hypothetical protein